MRAGALGKDPVPMGLRLPYYTEDTVLWAVYTPDEYPLLRLPYESPAPAVPQGDGGREAVPAPARFTEEEALGHFTQMLEYMSEQNALLQLLEEEASLYTDALAFVNRNGFTFYGAIVHATKEMVLRLNTISNVAFTVQTGDYGYHDISNHRVDIVFTPR